MRQTFPEYYQPTDEEFRELWEQCWFVPDANVLLNLYRYSPGTRKELLDLLDAISDQLWIPHQVGREYHRNRLSVIDDQASAYDDIREILESELGSLTTELNRVAGRHRHPILDAEEFIDRIESVLEELRERVTQAEDQHPDWFRDDPIKLAITNLLDGKVGSPYSSERLAEIYDEGRERYDQNIPPGYKDAPNKTEDSLRYGDLVLWFQILDQAAQTERPIILVTDERKTDWWWRPQGRTVGPRLELTREMLSKTGQRFYMYRPEQFMEYAREFLEEHVEQEAINEVRQLGRLQEAVPVWADAIPEALESDVLTGLEGASRAEIAALLEGITSEPWHDTSASEARYRRMMERDESLRKRWLEVRQEMSEIEAIRRHMGEREDSLRRRWLKAREEVSDIEATRRRVTERRRLSETDGARRRMIEREKSLRRRWLEAREEVSEIEAMHRQMMEEKEALTRKLLDLRQEMTEIESARRRMRERELPEIEATRRRMMERDEFVRSRSLHTREETSDMEARRRKWREQREDAEESRSDSQDASTVYPDADTST